MATALPDRRHRRGEDRGASSGTAGDLRDRGPGGRGRGSAHPGDDSFAGTHRGRAAQSDWPADPPDADRLIVARRELFRGSRRLPGVRAAVPPRAALAADRSRPMERRAVRRPEATAGAASIQVSGAIILSGDHVLRHLKGSGIASTGRAGPGARHRSPREPPTPGCRPTHPATQRGTVRALPRSYGGLRRGPRTGRLPSVRTLAGYPACVPEPQYPAAHAAAEGLLEQAAGPRKPGRPDRRRYSRVRGHAFRPVGGRRPAESVARRRTGSGGGPAGGSSRR